MNFLHTLPHLHIQASLHIEKELCCSETSGPEKSQDTSQRISCGCPSTSSIFSHCAILPSIKASENIWDLCCLLPSEFNIKENFFDASRKESLNPQKTHCSGMEPCHHRTQPVDPGAQVKLSPSKTSLLGARVLVLFQILRSDINLHNRCLSRI